MTTKGNKINNKAFERSPYFIVLGAVLILISAWFIGPPVGTWAQSQNRPQTERPEVNFQSVFQLETYQQLDVLIGDRLKLKPLAVEVINSAALWATGMPISPFTTGATLTPTWFSPDYLDSELYLSEDFLAPCNANEQQMRQGLQNLGSSAQEGGKKVAFIVAPNKSSVNLEHETGFAHSLMECSSGARKYLEGFAEEQLPIHLITPEEIFAQEPEVPYWTGDTHWKPRAAESFLIEMMRSIDENLIQLVEANGPFTKTQDLLAFLSINKDFSSHGATTGLPSLTFDTQQFSSGGSATQFHNSDASGSSSVLVVVDSFIQSADLIPKIAQQFSTGTFVHWNDIGSVGELTQYDVVIMESVERYSYLRLSELSKQDAFMEYLEVRRAH